MTITPKFNLTQTEQEVLVIISVPHIRVSAAETYVDEDGFGVSFYCKPYLLKLRLPYPVISDEDPRCRAVYDPLCSDGTLTLHLPKVQVGQHFPDLDFTSTLLQPIWNPAKELSSNTNGRNLVEVVSSETFQDGESDEEADRIAENFANLKCSDSNLDNEIMLTCPRYGFNKTFSKFFTDIRDELIDMIQLPNPDQTTEQARHSLRENYENAAFDMERYLGDFAGAKDDPIFIDAMNWTVDYSKVEDSSNDFFNEREKSQMAELPRKEYLIRANSIEEWQLFQGLGDILYGYAYDQRVTQGEDNIESAWTIVTLSATLSWLQIWDRSLSEVIVSSARRSLCFPYLRNWELSMKVFRDVALILTGGRRRVLKCMLHLHRILAHSEFHYLHNKLYISDYCVWLQTLNSDERLCDYGNHYNEALSKLSKDKVGLELIQLENFYKSTIGVGRSPENKTDLENDSNSSSECDSGTSESSSEHDLDTSKSSSEHDSDTSESSNNVSPSKVELSTSAKSIEIKEIFDICKKGVVAEMDQITGLVTGLNRLDVCDKSPENESIHSSIKPLIEEL